jgi:hypothetical protein
MFGLEAVSSAAKDTLGSDAKITKPNADARKTGKVFLWLIICY